MNFIKKEHLNKELACSKSPKSLHKLVLPENGSKIDFCTALLGEMSPKAVFRASNCDNLVRK